MNRINHFDIYADNTARASKFYSDVFGWKFEKWESEDMNYWMITTGPDSEPGINGGMALREKMWKDSVSVGAVTITVGNIDEAIEKVKKAGGNIMMEKMAIAGAGYMANFKDPEGNVLSLMQTDMAAK